MSRSSLLALPAELRNAIFELAFTQSPGWCNLLQPNLPSNAVLVCSHELYQGTKSIHEDAVRNYFACTHFNVEYTSPVRGIYETGLELLKLRQGLRHIRVLEITMARTNNSGGRRELRMTMIDGRGAWKVNGLDTYRRRWEFYVVVKPCAEAITKGSAQGIKSLETEAEAKAECARLNDVAGVDRQILAAIYCLADWWEMVTWSRAAALLHNQNMGCTGY